MLRALLIMWVSLLGLSCQVISGEANREFSETSACEGSDCFPECAGDCPCTQVDCDFRCTTPPCSIRCNEEVEGCRLDCGTLTPGSTSCRIENCEDSDEQLCPDGTTLTCRASCP